MAIFTRNLSYNNNIDRLTRDMSSEICSIVDDQFVNVDNKIKGIHSTLKENNDLMFKLEGSVNKIKSDTKKYNENYMPTIEWYKENRDELVYMYDTVSEFYMSMAFNPVIRFLNHFFHWYYFKLDTEVMIEESPTETIFRSTECIVVCPCILKNMDIDNDYLSYNDRKKKKKECYKKNMKIFKKRCKSIHGNIKDLPIRF